MSKQWTRAIRSMAMTALVIFVIVCMTPISTPRTSSMLMEIGTLSAVVLVAAVVLTPTSAMVRVLSGPGPVWLGARSYGIYLYHYPLVLVFIQSSMFHGAAHIVAVICCMIASIVIAALSFRFVETPFLLIKGRFQNARGRNRSDAAIPRGAPIVAEP